MYPLPLALAPSGGGPTPGTPPSNAPCSRPVARTYPNHGHAATGKPLPVTWNPPAAARLAPPRTGTGTPDRASDLREEPRCWGPATAARLRLLREQAIRRVLAGCDQPAVACYALTDERTGGDPRLRMAQALTLAEQQGWRVMHREFDVAGDIPALRPGLARIHSALIAGRIQGVVAASRADISGHDTLYLAELHVLHTHQGFLALTRSEGAL